MKLFIVKVVNGNPAIVSEWTNNVQGAIISFHDTCKTLWNAADVTKATVRILDEQLDCYQGYNEIITHEVAEESAE